MALYASPYVRARETARAVGEAVGLEPVLRPRLAELDVGDAAGYRFDDWADAFPEEAERFRAGGIEYAWPGGESGRQLAERVAREMDHIVGEHREAEGTVVVVSHGGALAWMLVHLLREPVDEWPSEYLHIANCSVTELEVSDDGSPATVVMRNETGHLSPEPGSDPDPDAEAATGEDPD
jgi:probable phosphoglycerate mutase